MLVYIVCFLLGFVFHKALPDLRSRSFAAFMAYFTKHTDPKMKAFKKEALKDIKNVKSGIPELKKKGTIKILEIGVGTGTNFQHYPDGCQLVVVDPNPHFKSYYDENRAKFTNIQSEEIIVGYGEDLDMVPDNSVDVVVITLVLCSVKDIKKVVDQVKRVLVPGGKFFYLEHIREWDSEKCSTKQLIQDLLTNYRIWPSIFDGCDLNRNPQVEIEAAGFSSVEQKLTRAPIDHPIFQIINPHLIGCATK